jgi:hypothetical protein
MSQVAHSKHATILTLPFFGGIPLKTRPANDIKKGLLPRSIFVPERSRVYTQHWMGPRLLIAVLVLALSGANSDLASMCAAYCMSSSSVGSAAVHHHQMDSQPGPTSISHPIHSHDKDAECAECPPTSGNGVKQKGDCESLAQMQALKEGLFNLDASSGLIQFDATQTPARAAGLTWSAERSLVFDASRTTRTFPPPLVPLRI